MTINKFDRSFADVYRLYLSKALHVWLSQMERLRFCAVPFFDENYPVCGAVRREEVIVAGAAFLSAHQSGNADIRQRVQEILRIIVFHLVCYQ